MQVETSKGVALRWVCRLQEDDKNGARRTKHLFGEDGGIQPLVGGAEEDLTGVPAEGLRTAREWPCRFKTVDLEAGGFDRHKSKNTPKNATA